jgi:tetratricopeptide (TPR) repeat protein
MPSSVADEDGDGGRPETGPLSSRSGKRPIVWGKIPLRNVNFTGREDLLSELHGQLAARVTAVLPQDVPAHALGMSPRALYGMGGVGKTQLAIEYAYRYSSDYDVVWWIPADQESLIAGNIAGLAPRLDLPAGEFSSIEDTAAAVLDRLRRGVPYDRWLLIFDGADQHAEIRQFLLADGPGHTIVTSRNPDWRAVINTVTVNVFTEAESRDFLARRLPDIDDAESGELSEALGHLPLALDHAGALQALTGMSVDDYLQLFQTQAARLLAQGHPAEYPVPVTAAWSLSVSRLKEENPEAVELLRCCAFFGPQPIPRAVLSDGRNAVGPPLGPILGDPLQLSQAIGNLARYSLAQVDQGRRTLQVHRVIQAVIRDQLSSGERQRLRSDVHLLLAAATPADADDATTWPRYEGLVAHYEPAGIIASRDHHIRQRVLSVIRYLYMIGNFTAAMEMTIQARREWSDDSNTQPDELAAARRHQGNVLHAIGQYQEAFTLNAESVVQATDKLGVDHIETMRVTNSHGADLRALGDFNGAYSLDEENVRRHRLRFSEGDALTLRAQNNLGIDLVLLGRYQEAVSLAKTNYQAARSAYGRDDHPSVLMSLINLACALRLSGLYADACYMSEDTHASCLITLGSSHPISLFAATDLAIALRKASPGPDTLPRITELLRRQESFRGEGHHETLAAAVALANALREAGNLGEADELADRTTRTYTQNFGSEHPYTLGSRGGLAVIRRLNGNPGEAREIDEAVVAGFVAVLGRDHPYTLACAVALASDLAALNDPGAARARGEDSAARLRQTLGENHPLTLACTLNLGADLLALGLNQEADALRAKALPLLDQVLGTEHPQVQLAAAGARLECDFDPPPT